MAYRIAYDAGEIRKAEHRPVHLPKNRKLLTAIALCLLLAIAIGFAGAENVKSFLLPGDAAVTEAAFSGMVENLRAGESLPDAITAFCREILDGAGVYE